MEVNKRDVTPHSNSPIKILIVEDHSVVRVGLHTILNQTSGLEVVGEATTCEEARVEAARLRPTVILMDLRLPDGSGVEACRDIMAADPEVKILFLTSYRDDESMFAAVLAGASGYLLKEVGPEQLTQAIELVAEGHSILDRQAIERVQTWARGHEAPQGIGADWELTPQQRRILALVSEGKTNKEIASALGLSDNTVRNYLVTVFEKLHITRRSQAAALYTKQQSQ